jgi:hypothetical protein
VSFENFTSNHAAGNLTERYQEGASWRVAACNCSFRRTLIFRSDESGRPILSSENRIFVRGRADSLAGIWLPDSRPRLQYQRFDDIENLSLDLNIKENCERGAKNAGDIYNLAANMGGMGFIEHNKALCMLSVLINTQMLHAAVKYGVKRPMREAFGYSLKAVRRSTTDFASLPPAAEEPPRRSSPFHPNLRALRGGGVDLPPFVPRSEEPSTE